MKKVVILLITLLTSSSFAMAITDEDKTRMRAIIDETFKYESYNPPYMAEQRAKEYVKDTYFYEFIKCKNNCEIEWDYTRAKTRSNIRAKEVFDSCMVSKCNHIKEVEMQECYDYIQEYIQLKNKNIKK